jgi:hypothetical protein
MPTFEIPDGPTTVELKRSGDAANPGPATGSIAFSVTNKSSDGCDGRLSVVPSGGSKEEWFAIDGDRERTFAAGETQTATIKVSAPKDVAAGDYPFRLRAVAVNDPDNDHAEGPVATAKVPPAAPPPPPTKWWLWILIGLLVLAAIGAGIYFAFFSGEQKKETVTQNTVNTVTPPVTTAVPSFVDKTVEQAKTDAQGFTITEQPGTASGKTPRTILSQVPAAGSQQAAGAVVQVTFDPGVTVPSVVGQNAAQAILTLQGVPLHIQTSTTRCEDSGTPDQIIEQDPKSGAVVTKDSGVNVVVRTVGGMFGATRMRCGMRIPPDFFNRRALEIAPPVSRTRVMGAIVRDHRN